MSRASSRFVKVHAFILQKIIDYFVETVDPADGVFPDSMRILQNILVSKAVAGENRNRDNYMFKDHIGDRQSPQRTNEEHLLEEIVNLYGLCQ